MKEGTIMSGCTITLKPYAEHGTVTKMEIVYRFEQLERAEGEELCRFQVCTVSIPGCEPEALWAEDACGALELSKKESKPYPYEFQHIFANRPLRGAVAVGYTVRPRELKPETICGPYFDLRTEDGGANSAGISFLADFMDYEGEITLHWDFSEMPAGSAGVCTWGEGDVTYTGPLEKLRQCYFAFGRIQSITEGDFGFYWLSEPQFDIGAIAVYTRELFGKMRTFFRDTESVYRIFVRKDPFNHSGGTALRRSYMFGWNEAEPVTVQDKQNILAHEMVHNWPQLNDDPYGITSWYSEGTAEYYSIMLPLREGLIDKETALREIQTRTDGYYTNPTRHMENIEAAQICWQDRRAQRIPYGRGIFFLANTDVQIREATKGARSLDDVVLRIIELDRAGVTLGNEVFLKVVRELSGVDVSAQLETMRTGDHFDPLEDSFDGHFHVTEKTMAEADTGTPVVSYAWSLRKEEIP